MIGYFRAFYKTVSLFFLLFGYVLYNAFKALVFGHDYTWTLRTRRKFARFLLWFLNVEFEQKGTAPQGAYIFIGNHRSYMDPVLAHQDMMALPVAKAEIGDWPIIGWGVKISGVLLVKRENKGSRKQTRQNIVTTIRDGHSVLVYPEGTSHARPTTLDFKPGTFRIAVENKIPIVPVAVEFKDPADAFINDDQFVAHFFNSFRKPKMYAKVRFGEPILSDDAEALIRQTKDWIDRQLLEVRKEFGMSLSDETMV